MNIPKIIADVTAAYIKAVYFTDTGDLEQPDSSIEPSVAFSLRAYSDVADFMLACERDSLLAEFAEMHHSWEAFGHDFWFTRNRHGAGFWDRGLGVLGDKLSDLAKSAGSLGTYEDSDNLLAFE